MYQSRNEYHQRHALRLFDALQPLYQWQPPLSRLRSRAGMSRKSNRTLCMIHSDDCCGVLESHRGVAVILRPWTTITSPFVALRTSRMCGEPPMLLRPGGSCVHWSEVTKSPVPWCGCSAVSAAARAQRAVLLRRSTASMFPNVGLSQSRGTPLNEYYDDGTRWKPLAHSRTMDQPCPRSKAKHRTNV
jgi:hypothetical protein